MKFKEIIKSHLDKMSQQDAAFRERYNLKSKSLDDCVKYIISEAQKQREGNCAVIDDAVVFSWAVHYYQEDELKIDNVRAEVTHSKETSPTKPIKPKKTTEDNNCKQLDLFADL